MPPPARRAGSSRAAVSSSQRRSASRWNSAWSQISWSAMSPSRLRAVSSRISRRCSARWASSSSSAPRPVSSASTTFAYSVDCRYGSGFSGWLEPALDVGHAGLGDRVALALRPGARLDAVDLDEPVLEQPRERRVDLPVAQRPVRAEALVVGPLEVVAVSRAALEQPEEGRSDRHATNYTHSVYAQRIAVDPSTVHAAHGSPLRPQKRRDHRARRPRQDHARRRDAVAVRRVPREPGRQRPRDGLDGPRAREGHHDPRQEHGGPLQRREAQHHRHAGPRRLRRRGRARAEDGRRRAAAGRRERGAAAADALRAAQGARGQAAGDPRGQQGRPPGRAHLRGRRRGLRAVHRPRRLREPDRVPDRLHQRQGRLRVAHARPTRGRRCSR